MRAGEELTGDVPPTRAPDGRIASLDLIRGIAILGILAVNIAGFAGPMDATVSPAWNGAPSPADETSFLATFIVFEGKMRGLLSLLFGASMVLLVESAEARGRSGDIAQLRRLIWLAVIGYLHFVVLWWGDILFAYAFAGFFALLLRHLPVKIMLPLALFAFAIWHGGGMAGSTNAVLADLRYSAGASPPSEASRIAQERKAVQISADTELRREKGSWSELAAYKLTEQTRFPIVGALMGMGETLPMMLIGMVLYRNGFFTGGWPRRRTMLLAGGTLIFGLAGTLALAAMAQASSYAPATMSAIIVYWAAVPHLAMTLGYAALLTAVARRLSGGRLARRIEAVGRMALSNYLGCSLVFTGVFYGWGMDMIGQVPTRWHFIFVLTGWIAMLTWSQWWQARLGQGPVERLWRNLAKTGN
ncbi:DUF418 domain-containing protein [Novosphingobium sp.]|uniref:DUF418 domain-containing protein n=1 Tax=Novosphingobium sp. TaxID=1874826 RepID=UPI00286E76E9|nr:DUF418 domain-containing protein [Novosphingobium sp.]